MAEIILDGVTKTLDDNMILDNISLHLVPGKIYGLRGKNGSGKTMLLRTICGLLVPTEGKVIIDGKELHKQISFPPSIGILIENPCFLEQYSGKENLRILQMLDGKSNDDEIQEALKKVGLDDTDKIYGKYSLGMKQKLGIAYAILGEPDIIILDEPINALDEKSVEIIRTTLLELREKNKIIIVACHDREELDYLSDEIFVMKAGKIEEE